MARSFNGTSQYLEYVGAVVSSGAATFAGWMYLSATTDLCYGPGVYYSGNNGSFWHIRHVDTQGWGAFCAASSLASSRYVGSNSTTGWHHVVGTWASVASTPALYVDGTAVTGTAQAGSGTLAVDRTGINTNRFLGVRYYGKGRNAEQAIWSAELTAAEAMSLCKGYTPLEIRPDSLVSYYPLGGHYGQFDLDRWKNRYDLTPSGSPTWADHPRVIYPGSSFAPIKATAASSTKYWLFGGGARRIIGGGIGT